jgi:hypothetical protein
MKISIKIFFAFFLFATAPGISSVYAHDIVFCGERIPVDDKFVADKLMNIIRRQIPNVNLPQLRQRTNQYFGIVESYLQATRLPEDFKYLAIVESGFQNVTSPVGAAGFWQLMPETARERGLIVNDLIDERNDIYKSTYAACKVLANYYLEIKRRFGVTSWVLTSAAYNFGIGNMSKAITKQGKDYFQMNLNPETAGYVYKIIAVKELFEYPELYMQKIGYNVFNAKAKVKKIDATDNDDAVFSTMTVKVNQRDGNHPEKINTKVDRNDLKTAQAKPKMEDEGTITFISAEIVGKYKKFDDGDLVSFKLQDNLQVANRFTAKGNIIQGRGWLIDDKIYIDLGYDRSIVIYDLNNQKGISFASLKKKETVIMKIINFND